MNGLLVCVNAVMVDVERFEWFTCIGGCCNGKRGMIGMYG